MRCSAEKSEIGTPSMHCLLKFLALGFETVIVTINCRIHKTTDTTNYHYNKNL